MSTNIVADHRSSFLTMSSPFVAKGLYGGAITCNLPSSWVDVSEIRQVPDHQEVYLGPQNESLVVEILEHQTTKSDNDAARYFFEDLAEANGSTQNNTFTIVSMGAQSGSNDRCICGIGMQEIRKGKETDIAGNPRDVPLVRVQVELAVVRLPQVQTDLLLTLSRTKETPDTELSTDFQQVLSTLQIRDWSLFV